MKMGLISKQKGKEMFLQRFFKNYSEKQFEDLCEDFAINEIPNLIRAKAVEKIEQLCLNKKNLNIIVSASPENWISPWASKFGIEVIATKLEFRSGIIKIAGENCNGQEKVRRIKEAIDLSKFEKIIAYGDSKGDFPMFSLSDEKHLKPFR